MKEFGKRVDPKAIARTALTASLPLAAGLSACGDGPTSSGIPARIETPMSAPQAPVNPTTEPKRTTITLEANCPPTPYPDEYYESVIQQTIKDHGGAIIVRIKGLTCEKDYAPYVSFVVDRMDSNTSPYDRASADIYGFSDKSDSIAIFPATSCTGEYRIGEKSANPNLTYYFRLIDEKTGVAQDTFKLNEDCKKIITLEPNIPKALN